MAAAQSAPTEAPAVGVSIPGVPGLFRAPLPKIGDAPMKRFDNGAVMYGDIIYSEVRGYRPMMLDLYLPEGADSAEGLPLVMWYHGGGYQIGNPRADWTYGDWTEVLGRLAARGFAVAAVTYRFQGEAPFPAQLDDGRAAISFVQANAERWHIDPSRTYVWGLSAGAHLAQMLGVTGDGVQGPAVAGTAEWFGPSDLVLRSLVPERAKRYAELLGCPELCSDEELASASPVTYVNAETAPFFIAQGVEDGLVPVEQADVLYAALQEHGVPVTYQRLEGMGHGFVGGTTDQHEQILLDTFAFFEDMADQ